MANQEAVIANTSADSNRSADLNNFLATAREADARYDHETAVACYTAALELPDLTPNEQYEALAGRTQAYFHWGYGVQAQDDWLTLIDLARETPDPAFLAETIVSFGVGFPNYELVEELGREALSLAGNLTDKRLLARAKMMLAWGGRFQKWRYADEALQLAREAGDKNLIFEVIRWMANWARYGAESGRPSFENLVSEVALLAQESGSFYEQACAAQVKGWYEADLALALAHFRQAFDNFQVLGNQFEIDKMANSIGLRLLKLGLYRRALAYANLAVEGSRRRGDAGWVANCLEGVGRATMGIGLLDEAEKAFKEGQGLPQVVEHWRFAHIYGLGLLALERDQPLEAIGHLKSVVLSGDTELQAHAYADLGIAYLSMGEPRQARQHSLEAEAIVEAGIYSLEYPLQNIWWRRYQVLAATGTEGAFEALGRAQTTMLDPIEALSDEGLRRNYLNKVAINRDITLTWTAAAARRGLSTAPFTEHQPAPGNLQDQFRRVLAIGGRLSAQHDPTTLADFIIDEFVELSGAERVLLLLLNEDGDSFPAASFNAGTSLDLAQPLLERVRHERQSLLRQDVGDVPEGAVPQLHQRSLIALPLIAQGRLLGLLYGDIRQIFGRFDEADLNLLSMFANQAAAALENAELVSTLEDKVEERTVELKSANESLAERNNELLIINGVQQALAAELDLQSIFNIVGDKLSEIYGTDSIALWTYDWQTDMAFPRYYKESGKVANVDPQPPGPIGRILLQTHEPILLRTGSDYAALEHIQPAGTIPPQSGMFVPLIVGNQLIGVIYLFSFKTAAFDESDLRLLTTLVNSMSVTLENARLFNDAKEARAEAERANKAKSAFMSNMSHELRTPLNAIIGFTRIVQRKTKDQIPSKQTENLGKVLSSSEHLLGLINTVLDIAKIEAGRMDVINTRFPIGQLIEATTMVVQPLLKTGVDLNLNIASGIPEVNSDRDKIGQILLNLFSNAAKFTREGSITVSAHQESDTIIINVTDTGIGMNEEALGRVFEEFQQADANTRKIYGGTGLGMPISKHLAQLLRGGLTVTSNEGEGSTFTLKLPIEGVNS